MEFKCDYQVYHPLGGASYVFEKNLIEYVVNKTHKKNIVISIGAQPNSSPHFGTLCVFSLAFSLAKKIKEYDNTKKTTILYEVVDTAPSETITINNIKYQKDLKGSKKMLSSMDDFKEILDYLSEKNQKKYNIRYQSEFNSQKEIASIIDNIVKNKDEISPLLDPVGKRLRIRSACPICELVDKEGIYTKILNNELISYCPNHGEYKVDLKKETNKLEYNTPLRNLIRAIIYGQINTSNEYDYEIIRITGGDYSGFYQEELLYKVASILDYKVKNLPIIIYCPQILDWSGAKLSKSLYVKEGAYNDLPKYLLNFKELKKECNLKGLDIINEETDLWLDEPYRLFRNYTVYYFIKLFNEKLRS